MSAKIAARSLGTTRVPSKDPAETLTVIFDYSAIGTPQSPAVTIALRKGTDPTPGAMLVGSPTHQGHVVQQRVAGGVAGAEYALRCLAAVGTDSVLVDVILPVRSRPNPA